MTDDEQLDIFNRITAFLKAKLAPYSYKICQNTSPLYVLQIKDISSNLPLLDFYWSSLSAFFKGDLSSVSFSIAIAVNRSYVLSQVGKDAIRVFDIISGMGNLSTYEEMCIYLDMHS